MMNGRDPDFPAPTMGEVLRRIADDPEREIDWRFHFRQLAQTTDAFDELQKAMDARATALLQALISVGLVAVVFIGLDAYLYWQLSECLAK